MVKPYLYDAIEIYHDGILVALVPAKWLSLNEIELKAANARAVHNKKLKMEIKVYENDDAC